MMKLTRIEDLEDIAMPLDMADELRQMWRDEIGVGDSVNWEAEYDTEGDNQQKTAYLFIPAILRGAVCEGGNSVWGDAHDMEDLKHRWANYETEWRE